MYVVWFTKKILNHTTRHRMVQKKNPVGRKKNSVGRDETLYGSLNQ
jgi:hypothetical protein